MSNYSIIVAIADDLTIGKDNLMPWHVPEDLKQFKQLTMGNIIIMGRKTFESIGRALPGRTTIVVTSTPGVFNSKNESKSLFAVGSLDEALQTAAGSSEKKVFVAGGASIYSQAMAGADKLYLSRIPGEYEGDTFFPEFQDGSWELESSEDFPGFRLEVYLKKQ